MDYLVKVLIFAIFVTALHFFIDVVLSFFSKYLADLPFTGILCQLGIFQGLNLFLSIVVSAFFVKQLITFWK